LYGLVFVHGIRSLLETDALHSAHYISQVAVGVYQARFVCTTPAVIRSALQC